MKEILRKEEGITLVALLITIIILIILAAVAIKSVVEHDIVNQTIEGAEQYEAAQNKEKNDIDKASSVIGDYLYGNGGGSIKNPDGTLNLDNMRPNSYLGKYIDYEPKGEPYQSPISDNNDETKTYTISQLAGRTNPETYDTEDLKWRIWKIKDGKIILISNKPTTSKVILASFNGYNNGVKLLDDICSTNYTNNEYTGIVVRNMKIEDIEEETKVNYVNSTLNKGTENERINGVTVFQNKDGNGRYPKLWGEMDKEDRLPFSNRSYQQDWILGYGGGSGTINVIHSHWNVGFTEEKKEEQWKNGIYYELAVCPSNCKEYWLSSRFTRVGKPTSEFGLYAMNRSNSKGFLWGDETVNSAYYDAVPSNALRPIVSIPLTSCSITEGGNNRSRLSYSK